jgi:hypothetical protein
VRHGNIASHVRRSPDGYPPRDSCHDHSFKKVKAPSTNLHGVLAPSDIRTPRKDRDVTGSSQKEQHQSIPRAILRCPLVSRRLTIHNISASLMLFHPRIHHLSQIPDKDCQRCSSPHLTWTFHTAGELRAAREHARKMLLVHQSGSVKVGEIVR